MISVFVPLFSMVPILKFVKFLSMEVTLLLMLDQLTFTHKKATAYFTNPHFGRALNHLLILNLDKRLMWFFVISLHFVPSIDL